jgi:hypothetical protein
MLRGLITPPYPVCNVTFHNRLFDSIVAPKIFFLFIGRHRLRGTVCLNNIKICELKWTYLFISLATSLQKLFSVSLFPQPPLLFTRVKTLFCCMTLSYLIIFYNKIQKILKYIFICNFHISFFFI